MTLSIIIVNYNTKDLTIDCIKSVFGEGSGLKTEVIVVDNASIDSSVSELRKLQKSLKNFQLIENKKNLGFAKAVNQGIKSASGKFILLLNSDTKVKKAALGRLVKFAQKTKEVGVVGARLLNPDGSIQPSCFHFPTVTNAIREFWLGQRGAFSKYAPKGKKPVVVDVVVGAAFLITPSAQKRVGLFDERYFMYFEDFDYCRRVWQVGLKVYYLPEAQVIHYHGVSGRKIADEENQWKRLIPSSKIYHGVLKHYLLNLILWSGQKAKKFLKKK